MRWVCKDDVEECLVQEWRDRAANALTEINNATSQSKRNRILRKAASTKIWRDFYDFLPETLKKKCWYCEAEEIRSDMPVDHYRPKGKVENDTDHEGYWWLAFDWENYRCACTYCNSRRIFEDTEGGKACKFPIVDPTTRAYSSTDNLAAEAPDFLDPFDPDDFKLLWFDGDGLPEAAPSCTDDQARKVTNSIDIFHLNEQKISRRRNQIRLDIKRSVEKLESDNAEDARSAKSYLRKITRDTEMLSRAACVYLSNYRYLPAVKEILNAD
jgi:uncharacterized protein (TIGR02646 family)